MGVRLGRSSSSWWVFFRSTPTFVLLARLSEAIDVVAIGRLGGLPTALILASVVANTYTAWRNVKRCSPVNCGPPPSRLGPVSAHTLRSGCYLPIAARCVLGPATLSLMISVDGLVCRACVCRAVLSEAMRLHRWPTTRVCDRVRWLRQPLRLVVWGHCNNMLTRARHRRSDGHTTLSSFAKNGSRASLFFSYRGNMLLVDMCVVPFLPGEQTWKEKHTHRSHTALLALPPHCIP